MNKDLDEAGCDEELENILKNALAAGEESVTVWKIIVDLEKTIYRIFFSREELDDYIDDLKPQHPDIDEMLWSYVLRIYKVVMKENQKSFHWLTK